jgi:hypothetical protein
MVWGVAELTEEDSKVVVLEGDPIAATNAA